MKPNLKTFPILAVREDYDEASRVEQLLEIERQWQKAAEWKQRFERELRQLDDNPQELMDWIVEKTGVHDDGVLTEYANLLRLFIEQKLLGDAE